MIAVVDSGVANLNSVMMALERLGARAEVTCDPEEIRRADRVILPGVGSAAAAMRRLEEKQLVSVLRGLDQPVLGICLGMQLLFDRSAESGGVDCLALIPGEVLPLQTAQNRPVPHTGWNQIAIAQSAHRLLSGIPDGSFFYFVHGYVVPDGNHTLASCEYGVCFAAVAGQRNIFGCQFHPERSGAAGARLLKNFVEM